MENFDNKFIEVISVLFGTLLIIILCLTCYRMEREHVTVHTLSPKYYNRDHYQIEDYPFRYYDDL